MNAALKDHGRSVVEERTEEMAERGSTPAVRPKFHISFGTDPRTEAQKEADRRAEAARYRVHPMAFLPV